MSMKRRRDVARLSYMIAVVLAAWMGVSFVTSMTSIDRAEARVEPGVHPVLVPGYSYLGNASCSGAECHSADKATVQSGQNIGDELNIWSQWDPHAHTFEQLGNDVSKKISTALKIADAKTSDRCLGCHAINIPAAQRGELFDLSSGVSCEVCHGPAEKWKDPHAKAGWTQAKRQEVGPKGLMDQFGLVDTSNLSVRAHTCVACHLQIDKDMIDAGHPPLEFEMYAYNYYTTKKPNVQYAIHWDATPGQMTDAKLWATGQAAAHEASSQQVQHWKSKGWDTADAQALADVYKAGLDIAEKHFGARTAAELAQAQYTPAKAAAAAADLAKAGAMAQTKLQRRIIGFGVAALGSSVYDAKGQGVPDAFWNSYFTATAGEAGDAYQQALNAMAQIAAQGAQ